MGKMTASLRASLAPSSPATSSHLTLGFSERITDESAVFSRAFSGSSSSSSSSASPAPPAFGDFLAPPAAFLALAPGPPSATATRAGGGSLSCFLSSSALIMYPSMRSRSCCLRLGFFWYFCT
eukprot:Amastigsp_a680174_25.p4 type:complete len:123 gc:universal Amastigsp_a680174_25:523-155(-)